MPFGIYAVSYTHLKEEMYADKYLPSDSELQEMKQKLNTELEKLLQAE